MCVVLLIKEIIIISLNRQTQFAFKKNTTFLYYLLLGFKNIRNSEIFLKLRMFLSHSTSAILILKH